MVVLAKGDTRVFERAYGMADREAGVRNALDTRFNLGSINKAFTAVAIRQLAGAGKLALTDTLIRHLPDYPNRDVAGSVTIAQLLEHTSGIGGNSFAAPLRGSRGDLRTTADFLALFAHEPLQFEPGSRRQYSNAGYVVLGAVIERLSRMSYYDYVRTHIYEPAGMSRTAHFAVDSLPDNTAIGYTSGERTGGVTNGGARSGGERAALRRNSDLLPGRGSSAGGGYSTAPDLLRLLNALRDGKIFGGPTLGFGIAGGAPGLNAIVETNLPGGYDVIVIDTPPTRNALDFLDAPRRLTDFLESRVLRWFLIPYLKAGGGFMRVANIAATTFLRLVKRIVGGEVLEDTAEFFGNLEGMYDGFKERAREVAALLKSEVTSFVVITSPSEDSVTEATYFASRLNEAGLPFGALVVNRVHPKLGEGIGVRPRQLQRLESGGADAQLLARLLENEEAFMRVVELEDGNLDTLARKIPRHRWVRVPYLEREAVDFEGLAEIADHLF